MSNSEKRLILVLLIIIVIFSCLLIFKINAEPKFNPEIYERVYSEYENLINNENNVGDSNEENDGIGRNVVYKYVNASNNMYTVDGEISIPKIKIVYPIVRETSEEYLKVAPTKFAGPNMNSIGNYCIAGHNYKNSQFFSQLSQLNINDQVYLTSKSGRKVTYVVYAKYEVNENDLSCTSQDTGGKIETTLVTCTQKKENRLIVKCRATI